MARTDNPPITRRETLALAAVVALVVCLAALRAAIGLSFYDDSYYAVVPWRLASGARLFVDELSAQTLGLLASVPFVIAYRWLFGLTGIVLALRILYVAVATAVCTLAYRLLRPSVRPVPTAVALALPLLAPAYQVVALSYNTVSVLCFTLAVIAGFSAIRDSSRRLAVLTGVAAALGAASYPPFALGAIALLVAFGLLGRWRLLIPALLGASATALVFLAGVFAAASPDSIRHAFTFARSIIIGGSTPAEKLAYMLGRTGLALASPALVPMWLLALAASLRAVPARLRALALATIPAAAALPGAMLLARGDSFTFGASAPSWLIIATAGLLVPATLWAWRAGRRDLLRLLTLAAPFSAIGYVTVTLATSSSWNRGMASIALVPLAVGLLLCWATSLAEEGGASVVALGSAAALVAVSGLLFATVFEDAPLWQPHAMVASGPYAGIWASTQRVDEVTALTAAGARWVKPTDRVTFLGEREAYLLVGGIPHTPVTWLVPEPSDKEALLYFARSGHTPDVVFVDDTDIKQEGGYDKAPATDPMLAFTLANYRRADHVANFSVYVRR